MNRIVLLMVFIVVSGLANAISARSQARTESTGNLNNTKEKKKRTDLNAQQARLSNVLRVKAFAERAVNFRDLKIKTITLSRLGDLLWVDDEPYARQLFLKALDFLARTDDLSLAEPKLTARRVAGIRRQVIGYISRRDSTWAKRLLDSEFSANELGSFSRSQLNIETAYDLALSDQPKGAIEFAERSLRSGISPWIVAVLVQLRQKDEAAANALFLKVVEQLGSDSDLDPNTLLYIGTYIFTSPKVDPGDPTAVAQIGVGRVLVYDITADRPNIAPSLVRAYLEAATRVLTQPKSRPDRIPLTYVAGYMVLAKAQRFAPDLAPLIIAAMQGLRADVPPNLLDNSTYKNLVENSSPGLDESLTDIDKISGQDGRDERYVSLVALLWQKNEYRQARLVTNKVSDLDIRSRLILLIDFRQAALSLEGSEFTSAEKIAEQMPGSVERAVLWLGIAQAHVRANRRQSATDSVNRAVETARRLEDARRPLLLLNAAGQMLTLDADVGIPLFQEAVKDLNAQKPESLRSIMWRQKIERGRAVRVFPLAVKGINFEYQNGFLEVTKVDAETAISAVSSLTNEDPCSQSMIAVAAALLK